MPKLNFQLFDYNLTIFTTFSLSYTHHLLAVFMKFSNPLIKISPNLTILAYFHHLLTQPNKFLITLSIRLPIPTTYLSLDF